MEKRKSNEATDGEAVANPDSGSQQPQRRIELPAVESPSISPVELGHATDTDTAPPEATDASTTGAAQREYVFQPSRIHGAQTSTLRHPSAPQALCAARRIGGDRGGGWSGYRRGDK